MAKCPSCGEENPSPGRFCGNCGQPLALKCAACGQTVPAGNKFCPACGARVASTAVSTASAPAPGATVTPLPTPPPAYGPPPQSSASPSVSVAPSWPASPPPAQPSYGPPPAGPAYAPSATYGPVAPPPAASYGNVSMAPAMGASNSQWTPSAAPGGMAQPWPGAQPMLSYKGLGPRFVALLLDGIIVGLPSYLIMGVLFKNQMARAIAYGDTSAMMGPYALMMVISLAYSILLEASGGTLGKRILGIKIVDAQGNPPGIGKSVVRNLLRIVDALPFAYLIGIIAVASSQTKQRVGDKAAGTFVVAK